MDCIFCKIIKGDIPSYTVYEDDIVKAFLDIHPDSDGHILIIPKTHITDIDGMDENTFTRILEVTKKLKKALEEKLQINGLTLVQNNGCIQEVKHFHLHLKPFYKNKKGISSVEEIYNILKP